MTLVLSIAGFIGAGLVVLGLITRGRSGLRVAVAGSGLLAAVVVFWAVILPLIRGITSIVFAALVVVAIIASLIALLSKRIG